MSAEAMAQMPKYKCHKEVWALQIKGISLPQNKAGDAELGFEEPFGSRLMSKEWLDKHNPEVGGYYVLYKGGYESYSPAEAFLDGYSLLNSEVQPTEKKYEEDARELTKQESFEKELQNLINYYSLENESNTPDYVLADYLMACMGAFNDGVRAREKQYGRPVPKTN